MKVLIYELKIDSNPSSGKIRKKEMGNHSGLLRMKIEEGNEDLKILMKLGGKELNLMV